MGEFWIKTLGLGPELCDYRSMKSTPDLDTTPRRKMEVFREGLRQVLSVSKSDLADREKEYLAERATHPKRGPKPKSDRP